MLYFPIFLPAFQCGFRKFLNTYNLLFIRNFCLISIEVGLYHKDNELQHVENDFQYIEIELQHIEDDFQYVDTNSNILATTFNTLATTFNVLK